MFSMSLTWIGSEVKGQSKRYVVHTSTVLWQLVLIMQPLVK
jgi:hypothetical protein